MTPEDVFRLARENMRPRFVWGAVDCCTTACKTFADIHGPDPLAGFSEPYGSALQARRILKRAGGYLEWCRSTFGLTEVEPNTGDLALVLHNGRAVLAICIRRGVYIGKMESGMILTQGDVLGGWSCHK